MHFPITAAFGGRLATRLKLAHQSQLLLVAIFFSSAAKGLATSKARENLHKVADCGVSSSY